jgi:SAM-dependent methyltransferase
MANPDPKPTERFTSRVGAYVRYRPTYPPEAMRAMRDKLAVAPPAIAADIGAGTGIFSGLLLAEGFEVIAVEPNAAMRAAASNALGRTPGFSIVPGTAESTGLPDASVDFITAAQAFHWFQPERARVELRRISRPPHRVALLWNTRLLDATPFLRAYDELLLRLSDDYAKVRHQNVSPEIIASFFGPGGHERLVFPSRQVFDEEGFLGRALSSSYVPGEGHARHAETVAGLRAVFASHESGGSVELLYDTEIFVGCLSDASAA